jgi:predicted PolB exonuclease-like 3'-5' exonuclease
MNPPPLFVFDIETVPDPIAGGRLLGMAGASREEIAEALRAYHLERTNGTNDFLRQPFWEVVAISYAFVEVEGRPTPWGRDTVWEDCRYHLRGVQSIGTEETGEAELVHSFFHFLDRKIAEGHRPCLVSWNGRGFDLPVLRYRAMLHHIPAAGLFRAGDRWNNYSSRYALDWHCDLQEATSDFGAAARCRMDEVAALVGAPGKLGVDGSQVESLHAAGDLAAIRAYCETDVLNTYLIYLHWACLTGLTTAEGLTAALDELAAHLTAEGEHRPHLTEFLTAWHGAESGAPPTA